MEELSMRLQRGDMSVGYVLDAVLTRCEFHVPHSLLMRRSLAGGEFGGESEPSFTAVPSRDCPTPLPEKGSSPSRCAAKGSSVVWLMVVSSMAIRALDCVH
jgi:hypothetical protein